MASMLCNVNSQTFTYTRQRTEQPHACLDVKPARALPLTQLALVTLFRSAVVLALHSPSMFFPIADILYPGTGALDALLDFDQLTRTRSQGHAFGGFSEGRVAFEPTYKYNKASVGF